MIGAVRRWRGRRQTDRIGCRVCGGPFFDPVSESEGLCGGVLCRLEAAGVVRDRPLWAPHPEGFPDIAPQPPGRRRRTLFARHDDEPSCW